MDKNKSIQIFNPSDWQDLLVSVESKASLTTATHNLFHINRIEDYLRVTNFSDHDQSVPIKMTFYSIYFVTKEGFTRTKGLASYYCGQNTFFFLPAYEITIYESGRRDTEGFYIHFHMDLFTSDYRFKDLLNEFPFLNFNYYPLVTVDEETKEDVLHLLNRLEKEYKCGKDCSHHIVRTYLIALFTELKKHVPSPQYVAASAAYLLTEQYKSALARHFPQKQKVTDYADMLFVSPNHLNKCIQEVLNKSASDLLHEMLILETKVLLKQTNLTIAEIADKLGRDEVANFARFFKTKTGMTPKEYRQS